MRGLQTNFPVLANDSGGGSALDPKSLVVISPPSHASIYAIVSGGVITYASDPSFTGTDTLTYRICDVAGLCSTAAVTISVS
jgi:hypothetical protein